MNAFDYNEESDDIIKFSQWQYSHENIIGYGSKTFNNIDSETDAIKCVNSIDSDNNGKVSLIEWWKYIAT